MSAHTIDKDRILAELHITAEQFAETELDWDCLAEIRAHHCQSTHALEKAGTYILQMLQEVPTVHSLRMRVKDPDHLVAKIVRKKREFPELNFTVETYAQLVTDLIGIRALHLFKNDWRDIHDFIMFTWDLKEKPTANIRDGDSPRLTKDLEDAGFTVKEHPASYRSLHYLVKSQPDKQLRLTEIQVRTIFEEAWSEIDHRVRYPTHSPDPFLAEFLTIFNRLAGSADELGTFVNNLSVYLQNQATKHLRMQSQLEEKEAQLQGLVESLTLTKEQKDALQKQIEELKKSSRQALPAQPVSQLVLSSLGSSSFSDVCSIKVGPTVLINEPFWGGPQLTINPSGVFDKRCTKCGNTFALALGELSSLCPTCRRGS